MPSSRVAIGVLLAALLFRQPLEARMTTHMLLQLPMLLLAGVLLARRPASGGGATASRWDPHGIAGLLLATLFTSTWMVPRALDAAVAHLSVDLAKALMLVAAGAVGGAAWARAPLAVRLFMGGNLGWMLASMGVLLASTPARLCASYAAADQTAAGYGLVVLTVAIGAVAVWPMLRRSAVGAVPADVSASASAARPA